MIVGGSGAGQEFRKYDNNFYSGIVVKNNDPLKMNRVKIFIPELTNQPFDDWLDRFDSFIFKAPAANANPDPSSGFSEDKIGDWANTDVFEKVCEGIPWAEPLYPIMGESGNFRYYNNQDEHVQLSIITDENYIATTDEKPYPPSYWYENERTRVGDAFKKPAENMAPIVNPYSFSYNSFEYPNKAKGLFAVPEVGSKVWVFHYNGNTNFPIYFGVRRDYREFALVNDTDNPEQISNQYPNDFENGKVVQTGFNLVSNTTTTTMPPTISDTPVPTPVPIAGPDAAPPPSAPINPESPEALPLPEGGTGEDALPLLPPFPEDAADGF